MKKNKGSHPSALDAALKLLEGKDYSPYELTAKLAGRGYTPAEIDETLDILRRYHYVTETGTNVVELEKMSAAWLAKRRGGLSPSALRGLETFLLKKGFDPDLVRVHLERLAEQLQAS
ncbi:MAG: hypothetical protein N2595_03460 [bacterium]|nr:hypothetical protein [bacterium]